MVGVRVAVAVGVAVGVDVSVAVGVAVAEKTIERSCSPLPVNTKAAAATLISATSSKRPLPSLRDSGRLGAVVSL